MPRELTELQIIAIERYICLAVLRDIESRSRLAYMAQHAPAFMILHTIDCASRRAVVRRGEVFLLS